jgi:hypothetical protein
MTVRDKCKAPAARAPGKADSKALALYRLRLVGRGVLRADDALRGEVRMRRRDITSINCWLRRSPANPQQST